MQQAQVNYKCIGYGLALVVALFLASKTAFSQGVAARGAPGSILTNNPKGACDPALGQADLTPGTDVDGKPVAPADLPAAQAPFQGQILVPLKARHGRAPAYVTVEGGKLDPLLNPAPACK